MAKAEKNVPKSLKECYATDSVSRNLWEWAKWVEKWGHFVLIAMLVIGIISSIAQAVSMAEYSEDAAIFAWIAEMVKWIFYAVIEYGVYKVLALLIFSLASLVQNTKVTANVALYQAAKAENFVEEELSCERKDGFSMDKILEKKAKSDAKEEKTNFAVSADGFIDVTCPNCKAELSFTEEQFQNPDGLTCPLCDYSLSL